MTTQETLPGSHLPVRHLMTVEEFLILDRAGAFEDLGHIELVEGEMFRLGPIPRTHGAAHSAIMFAFGAAVRGKFAELEVLAPVSARLERHSLPEVDLFVATRVEEDFVSRNSARIALEVAVTSLDYDLGRKARLYARTGVPEYWVVDVESRKIIRMAHPEGETYTHLDEFACGAAIPSVTIPDLVVDTSALA